METRETFAGLSEWQIALWYTLVIISTSIFVWGLARLVRKYCSGRGSFPTDRFLHRIARTTSLVLTHSSIKRRDVVAGLAHAMIFYGFVVLFIGTAILAFQDNVAGPVLGWYYWQSWFYLSYSFFLDLFGALLIVGCLVLAVKRSRTHARVNHHRVDMVTNGFAPWRYRLGDWIFVGTLLFLGVSGFLLESLRIAQTTPSFEKWSPIGWTVGTGLTTLGVDGAVAGSAHFYSWWAHGVAALAFVAAIPFTKAMHMIAAPASLATGDALAGKRLAELPLDSPAQEAGYGVVADLEPAHLLQLDACTRCGKCHEACPATSFGFPLSPRDLVLDLREQAEGTFGIRAALGVPPLFPASANLLGDQIHPETVWSCMQCMACVDICPVGIEHVPIINHLRRRLVDRGEMGIQLQETLERIHETGNSFGEPKRVRARWVKDLEFRIKDARTEAVDVLWFVGDYASMDPRNIRVTHTLARILHHAGVQFGILYEGERNAGNDVRRVGEEGLFTDLAETNIEEISSCDFERILTSDPHSFNTLKNEYPALGGDWDVVHHTQFLLGLFESGALTARRQLGHRVTYHDPCALGRYNGIFDEPRALIRATGCEIVEMERSRSDSLCCGAGGGRIWMSEIRHDALQRPSEARIDEAIGLEGVDYFIVCCPKDVTIYEDAIKTSGHEGDIELREITELVMESVKIEIDEP